MSWSWSYGNYIHNTNAITNEIVSWNPEVYSIKHYVIKSDVRWFSPGTPVSYTNKTDRYDIAKILLKVALTTTTIILNNTHVTSIDNMM